MSTDTPAQPTLQLWCETCEGTGKVDNTLGGDNPNATRHDDCPDCDGKGYKNSTRYVLAASQQPTDARCWCHTCRPVSMTPPEDMRMVLCPDCGNKRCPKAMHHDHYCTSSNATGQLGSAYGADLCRQCVTPKVCTRNQRCLTASA